MRKRGEDFLRVYNRFLKPKVGTFGPIKDNNEKYFCSPNKIAGEFRKTFFDPGHLQHETFNGVHEAHVNIAVASSDFFDTQDNDSLSEPPVRALKSCSCSSSFDKEQMHPILLQKVGARFKEILLKLFNMRLRKSIWPWNTS